MLREMWRYSHFAQVLQSLRPPAEQRERAVVNALPETQEILER
jgi:hypothetical protein